MAPLLSVCIPTLDANNGRAARLVASAEKHTQLDSRAWEVVVEDCHGELRGYTEPMNRAMERAKGRFLLSVNDDVVLADGWFQPLLMALALGQLRSTGRPWCATPDATHTDGPQVFHPWCMLWRRESWVEIGGLDEQFVLWCSDIDIARRLVDAGHPPVKVKLPNAVTHELNATTSEHPELGQVCMGDLDRFRAKWGTSAEDEKHRLAALDFAPDRG